PGPRVSPANTTRLVVTRVSHATREYGSAVRYASRTVSLSRSATLSGCPSDTDSDVKRNSPVSRMYVLFRLAGCAAPRGGRCVAESARGVKGKAESDAAAYCQFGGRSAAVKCHRPERMFVPSHPRPAADRGADVERGEERRLTMAVQQRGRVERENLRRRRCG